MNWITCYKKGSAEFGFHMIKGAHTSFTLCNIHSKVFQGPQILYNTPERINPLEHTGNYSATWILRSWYTGHWWVGCYIWYSKEGTGQGRSLPRLLLAVPNVTAHPPTASVPITILLYNGPLLCSFNVPIKGLNQHIYIHVTAWFLLPVISLLNFISSIVATASHTLSISCTALTTHSTQFVSQ